MRTPKTLFTVIPTVTITLLIATIAFSAILSSELSSQRKNLAPENYKIAHESNQIFIDINYYRQDNLLSPFALDTDLCYLAAIRANDLHYERTPYNHEGFLAMDYGETISKRYSLLSENLAGGYRDPVNGPDSWKDSPSHNSLLLSSEFTHACVASEGRFAVLIAGKP